MIVSYLRVSTLNQEVGRQEYQLEKLKIKFDKEYIDKCTGKSMERPQLIKMMNELKVRHSLLWKYQQIRKKPKGFNWYSRAIN